MGSLQQTCTKPSILPSIQEPICQKLNATVTSSNPTKKKSTFQPKASSPKKTTNANQSTKDSTTKIVINKYYGGLGLSDKALDRYNELAGSNIQYTFDIARNDPILVQVVETLGIEANDQFAKLHIVDIPDDVQWQIDEYDGMESVEEVHRSWS